MGVVGRADHHRVDRLVHRIEQLAEIGEGFGLGIAAGDGGEVVLVDVADGHDVLHRAGRFELGLASAADTDHRNVELGIRRSCVQQRRHGKSRQAGGRGSA